MASAGVGFSMLEVARMERALERHPSFAGRVFSEDERSHCAATSRPVGHLAARFAARGAVARALGVTDSGPFLGLHDVEVELDSAGRTQARLAGTALALAREQGVSEIALSLSLTREIATANAVAVSDAVRPRADEGPDAAKQMQASFKAARSVIDELELLQGGGGELPLSEPADPGTGESGDVTDEVDVQMEAAGEAAGSPTLPGIAIGG